MQTSRNSAGGFASVSQKQQILSQNIQRCHLMMQSYLVSIVKCQEKAWANFFFCFVLNGSVHILPGSNTDSYGIL